ncbi:MAG: amidohydrolase family protein [Desulfobacterales bacterium]
MHDPVTFTNALLIDGTGSEPLPDAAVVVAGGTFREIHPAGARLPKCGRRIDLHGKTLMPGLIDAHIHAGNIELSLEKTAALPPAVYVHRASRNLEADLDCGFTAVRDAAGLDPGFRFAIEQGLINGPRLFLSITPLTQSGGEGFNSSGVKPAPRNSLGVFPEVCDGPDAVRAAARRTLGRGADQIKIFADGEVVSQDRTDRQKPGQWKFTVEEMTAAVEAARAAGRYVMAHAYGPRAVANCLAAGVRSIEHGNLMDKETAAELADSGAFYVPTLAVYDALLKSGREAGLDAHSLGKLQEVGRKGLDALELAYRAGAKIASGSDVIGPFQPLKARELVLKAEVMSPMEAIVSATRTNAELLQAEKRIGTVETGKAADLIVIDGDPLADISLFESAQQRVVLVMKGGRIVKNRLG